MKRKTVVTILHDTTNSVEVYGDLKSACRDYGWKYWTLSRKKPPFVVDGYLVDRKRILQ